MNLKTVRRFNYSAILFFILAFSPAFALADPEPAADTDFIPYLEDSAASADIDFTPDLEGDNVAAVVGDSLADDIYSEDEGQDFSSLFENLEDYNFMYADTSFAWSNQTINSGRFDYKTLGPGDATKIPLVDSSLNKFYAHPIAGSVTSRFGLRRNQWHYGIDIKLKTGNPVQCALDGIVRVIQFDRRGYGNVVVVRHHNGLETLYGHLSKVTVKANQSIKAGESVGLGGNTGRSTGPHLHFEIRYYGEPFNPEYIIDFDDHVLKNDTLVLTRDNFEYLTELRRTVYYTVRKGDNLSSIAKRYGTTVNKLCSLNGITPRTILSVGRKLIVRSGAEAEQQVVSDKPARISANAQATAAQTAPDISGDVYYTVRNGDNLSSIAKRYGTTVNKLCSLNGITPKTVLSVGRRLVVGSGTEAEQQAILDKPAQASANEQSPAATAPEISEDVYYTVRSGDNLSRIAKRYKTTVDNLCELNGITPRAILSVGRRLIVKRGV